MCIFESMRPQPTKSAKPPMALQPPPIGHNRPPPRGWAHYCWRRAHKTAWKSPPIEVVRRRCKAAAGLGVSYRDYTAVLLDRGVHLSAVAIVLEEARLPTGWTIKLRSMKPSRAVLVLREASAMTLDVGLELRGRFVLPAAAPGREAAALCAGLSRLGANPAATALVIATQRDRRLAEAAGVARFVWRADFFG